MFTTIKRIIFAMITALLGVGVLAAPAQADASTNEDSSHGFKFTVTASSIAKDSAKVRINTKSKLLAKVSGADQVLWQNGGYSRIKVSLKQIKKAPRLKICTTGANSSRVIYKKAKGAKIVILRPGSCYRNTGKHNQRRVGFVQKVKRPNVMVFHNKSRQYRHARTLQVSKPKKSENVRVVGRIKIGKTRYYVIESCDNYAGGKVPMLKKVVQVRFARDLVYNEHVTASASADVEIEFEVYCPSNGARFKVKGKAKAEATTDTTITYRQRLRANAIKSLSVATANKLSIDSKTVAAAKSSITVEGTCGSSPTTPPTTPPPPVDNPPSIEAKGSPAHLYVRGNAAVFFEAWDPDGDDISVKVSATGGTVAGLVEVSTRWNGTPCPSGRKCYRATAWAGSNPGTMTITATVTAKGKNDTATVSFPLVADEF